MMLNLIDKSCKILSGLCVLCVFFGSCVPEDEVCLVELKPEIDAITGATPGPVERVKPPHLRKGEALPLMVIEGLENLALYKPVTAGSEPINGDLEQLTDGINNSGEFDVVEGPGWVQIDLGEEASIHAVVLWYYYRNSNIFNDVIVRVSDAADFSGNVITLFNNDHDNSSGMGIGNDPAFISSWRGEIIDASGSKHIGTTGRYVRVNTGMSVDGFLPRYLEIAVYGMLSKKKTNY